ncbi:RNA recognition motif domain-containing protein [Chitinolyticbacter meiyuanensis]|uniref:RNA recognition motif domain-containing protein n=1 Tax=Chitinolyticbacter meiyuanensis TaxID=682798 RepID=UPI0011E5A553|nr:RNA-binding protein [Chitinolyticbacter meiyuanensis]
MQILIGNLPPGTSSDDVRTLLTEQGVPGIGEIVIEEGPERTGALVKLDLGDTAIATVCKQLNGHHWNGRDLTANHTNFSWE